MRKIIISVAPVAASEKNIEPSSIAEEVIAAAKEGAAMVHLHVREKTGKLTKDLTLFKETVELICQQSDIIIQASTGGVSDLTIEERCAPLDYHRVETASLNGGSVNLGDAVYKNSFADIKYCAERVREQDILPEFEVFEIGMINNIKLIGEEEPLKEPLLFNLVLGHKGAMPATIEALNAFKQFVPANALWGITHYGRKNFSLLTAAVAMGASVVRIGFEDSNYIDNEKLADSNAVLVKKLTEIIRSMGMEVASPEEARAILKCLR